MKPITIAYYFQPTTQIPKKKVRERWYSQCEQYLKNFIADNPDHEIHFIFNGESDSLFDVKLFLTDRGIDYKDIKQMKFYESPGFWSTNHFTGNDIQGALNLITSKVATGKFKLYT